jgi:LysM repeat protein
MTYEKDPFQFKDIPDFALQPAREADEYNSQYMPGGNVEPFDATAYEKVFHVPAEKEFAIEEQEKVQPVVQPIPEPAVQPPVIKPIFQPIVAKPAEEPEVQPVAEPVAKPAEEPDVQPVVAEPVMKPADEPDVQPVVQLEEELVLETIAEPASEPAEDTEETAADLTEEESDLKEVAAPSVVEEPVAVPVAAPVPQPVPVPKKQPIKLMPMVGALMSSKLKLVDIKQKPQVRIFIEEDILVPDVKPDLARILSMDGKIKLSDKEIHTGQVEAESIKTTGDLILQTLYIPESIAEGEPMVAIESRIPFKIDTEVKTAPFSDLTVTPSIESIDYTVINERKFKVKATVALALREYSNVDIEIFEGIRDEEVQMLKETINLTDVAFRKTEATEIKEDLTLKDTMPEIQKILKYDVNVVENHKQITKEKAVINASVYCNVMYLGADAAGEAIKSDEDTAEVEAATPVLYQGKTEFTQFIRLDGDNNPAGQNPAGSRVNFTISSLNLTAKEDGNGKKNIIELNMNVDTGLELYKNIEKEVVTDVYHHLKDIQYDTDEIGLMSLSGSGVAELSVREIVNIPERYGNVDKIAYISGSVSEKSSYIEQGKSIVEGNVAIHLICISADEKKTPFSIQQEIPFRSSMEIPGINSEMSANNDIMLKELWFDKINNRQIEVNAGLLVNTAVSQKEKHQLVKNINFLETPQNTQLNPGIILYITRAGDTIWKIAKKYRTTIDEIKKINDLDSAKEIKQGTKLLIVAKNY